MSWLSGQRFTRVRRRYLIAYLLSILVHVFAGAFFIIRAYTPAVASNAPAETETFSLRQVLRVAQRAIAIPTVAPTLAPTAPPTIAPLPVATHRAIHEHVATAPTKPLPIPSVAPPPVRHPVQPRRAHLHAAPRRPELARVDPNAPAVAQQLTIAAPPITAPPSIEPSPVPTLAATPAPVPTAQPATPQPTQPPTPDPTQRPTLAPTEAPAAAATAASTPVATERPTAAPTAAPTIAPTAQPTARPTVAPTPLPTHAPTAAPTAAPAAVPTAAATAVPTARPSARPTTAPTAEAAPAAIAETARPATARPATAAPVADLSAAPTSAATALDRGDKASAHATPLSEASSGAGGAHGASPAANPGFGKASPHPSAAPSGSLAYAPHAEKSPVPGAVPGALSSLNARLNALIPTTNVTYSSKEYVNNLNLAIDQVKADYYKNAAPPQSVLDHALEIVHQNGLLGGPPAIVYIIKRQRIFGILICTGWKVEQPAGGGAPQGGYTFGPCGGDQVTPDGLPTLTPKTTAEPQAKSTP